MTSAATLAGYVHRFEPPAAAGARTLLLLHGTGGDENDLIPLGRLLDRDAALLSPRGPVLENGMPRFFRRIAEGVFDLEDLARRTDDLARFVTEAVVLHGIDASRLCAVGFSNGANVAASLLLRRPGVVRRAILLRAMVPFEPEAPAGLEGTRVLISAGRADAMIPLPGAERLAALLREAGADVVLNVDDAGHTVTPEALRAAQAWLQD